MKLNILNIEDNSFESHILHEHIKEVFPDFNFTSVARLKQGIEIYKQNKFDLVFLDLNLPDSFGILTLKRFIEATDYKQVIVYNDDPHEKLEKACMEAGIEFFINKDTVTPEQLKEAINQICISSRK